MVISRIFEYPLIFQNLDLESGRMLDVGCCGSKLPIELASLGYEVYGIDVNDYPLTHPNFIFIKQDVINSTFLGSF